MLEKNQLEKKSVECPHCGNSLDIDSLVYSQLREELSKDYNSQLAEEKKQFEKKLSDLQKQKEAIDKMKSELEDSIEKGVSQKLSAEKSKLERKLRDQIGEEKSEEIKSYKDQLDDKIKEAKDLNKMKADFQRLQREKAELQEKIEAESELKINQKVDEEKKRIRKEVEDKNELKVSEKQHIIDMLQVQLKDAQRKAESSSNSLRGETMELAIEDFLRQSFPLDIIEEIKHGAKGGDSLQIVNTLTKQNCGKIYYESKRTKEFLASWLPKFKRDMQVKGAMFGILVTESLPKDMERFGQRDGIWLCTYQDFKGLCFAIREMVILLSNAVVSQEGKTDKMHLLYDFLISSEFRMQIEAIVEGFTQMNSDLLAERRAMEGIWKKRQKQIEKVVLNTTHMYSAIRGIAGNAIGSIKVLELPSSEED